MRRIWIAPLLLLAACGGGGEGNEAAPAAPADVAAAAKPAALASLTGLYVGGRADRADQLCMIAQNANEARFGLVRWGANDHSCSGSGSAVRTAGGLRFAMGDDDGCAFEARVEGARITLPASLPDGCAYYCGARARLDDAEFTKAGGTVADARRATDLVGDPLCVDAAGG